MPSSPWGPIHLPLTVQRKRGFSCFPLRRVGGVQALQQLIPLGISFGRLRARSASWAVISTGAGFGCKNCSTVIGCSLVAGMLFPFKKRVSEVVGKFQLCRVKFSRSLD